MARLTVPIIHSKQTAPATASNRRGWEVYPCHLRLACGRQLEVLARSLDLGPQDDRRKRAPRMSWPCPDDCQSACTYEGRSDRVAQVEQEIDLLRTGAEAMTAEMDVEPGPGRTMWPLWLVLLVAAMVATAVGVVVAWWIG